MTSIAVALREEISRLARKEIRSQTDALRKASTQYRKHIAEMKRRVSELDKKVSFLEKQIRKFVPSQISEADVEGLRFSAKGLRSNRKRLGLSAADYGALIGVTAQTVYNWERERSRPGKHQLAILANLRSMGKTEAQERLEQLSENEQKKSQRSGAVAAPSS
jgi:DNA-binding transcriptional regulator YiaG